MSPWDDVRECLALLAETEGEFQINGDVYANAKRVANSMSPTFPAPRIWNHGPKSVVFDWQTIKFTVTAKSVAVIYG